jgi:hypothetical protein
MRSCLPIVLVLLLAACDTTPPAPVVNPAALAPHEWDHGPPWGPEEIPWIPPPPIATPYWWGYGGGAWIGRGYWWRGPYAHRGGGYWGRGRVIGGRRGRR